MATVTLRDPQLLVDPATPVAALLARPALASAGRAVVVDEAGRPLGIVSISALQRRIRAGELDEPAAEPLAA